MSETATFTPADAAPPVRPAPVSEPSDVDEFDVVQADYFSFDENATHVLPDGVSAITYKVLNEGERRSYLGQMNREVKIQKSSGDALLSLDPAGEKLALLTTAVMGWNLVQADSPVPFTQKNLKRFLDAAAPAVVDDLDKAVRKANSWLLADMTVEDIDKEIEALQETRIEVEKQEAGNDA